MFTYILPVAVDNFVEFVWQHESLVSCFGGELLMFVLMFLFFLTSKMTENTFPFPSASGSWLDLPLWIVTHGNATSGFQCFAKRNF